MRRILTVTLNPALDLSTETQKVAPGLKLRCAPPRTDPGGGGVNVSRAIRFLGGESTPLLAAGGGTGMQLLTLLRAEGLAPLDLGVDCVTRQSVAVIERDSGLQYRFVLPGPDWSIGDGETAAARIAGETRPGDLLVVSGSQPAGVAADFFPRLNDTLAPRRVDMLVDTSGKALEAAARGASHPGQAPLFSLRMDRAEARALSGRDLPDLVALADFAAELAARGAARIVAIASGAEGTVIADAEGRLHCRPPEVPVVSKVGAGDSFVAGMTLALARGGATAEACRQGVAAAAAAVMTPATRLCDGAAAARLASRVAVAPI